MGSGDARLPVRTGIALVRDRALSDLPPVVAVLVVVNYRLRGRYYVVDRLFAVAELRLGEKRQQIVRITRSAGDSRRARGGR
jgi:type IV secretion system protein VirB9